MTTTEATTTATTSTSTSASTAPSSLLDIFLTELPGVFASEVLPKLDEVDLALLSRVNHAAREAVKASGLPRIGGTADGPRMDVEWLCKEPVSLFVWFAAKAGSTWWEKADTCAAAAGERNYELLFWLRDHDCPWDSRIMGQVAYRGDMDMLRWLLSQGAPMDASVCEEAAYGGQLEALKLLRLHGCDWDEECCCLAAQEWNWDVLRWARKHGCDWIEEHVLSEVVYRGKSSISTDMEEVLDMLRWMRKHESVWDERIFEYAVQHDAPEVIKWAKDNNCPGAENY